MNRVLYFLTLVTTVFIPAQFITGLYGMNFDNMPELRWKYSYFVLLGGMLAFTVVAYLVFRRMKLLSN